jgi:hypothetical protein
VKSHGLVVLNPFSSSQSRENLSFFAMSVKRNYEGNRLAYSFVLGIPEQALCSRIPRPYNAVERLANDCIF